MDKAPACGSSTVSPRRNLSSHCKICLVSAKFAKLQLVSTTSFNQPAASPTISKCTEFTMKDKKMSPVLHHLRLHAHVQQLTKFDFSFWFSFAVVLLCLDRKRTDDMWKPAFLKATPCCSQSAQSSLRLSRHALSCFGNVEFPPFTPVSTMTFI